MAEDPQPHEDSTTESRTRRKIQDVPARTSNVIQNKVAYHRFGRNRTSAQRFNRNSPTNRWPDDQTIRSFVKLTHRQVKCRLALRSVAGTAPARTAQFARHLPLVARHCISEEDYEHSSF